MKHKYPKKTYILYDGRARLGNTDRAVVLETSEEKPTFTTKDYGEDAIWAELEMIDNTKKIPTYGNEKLMWEIV